MWALASEAGASTPGSLDQCAKCHSPFLSSTNDHILLSATPNREEQACPIRSIWHGRYYVDIPGQEKRRKLPVPLGSVHTMKKTEAKRKLRALLEEMGVNSDSHLERIETGARTFSSEAAWKENRLPLFKSSCQETMGSPLDKYLFRQFGSLPVAAIDERRGAGIHYCADANGAQVAQWRQKEAQPQDYSQHCRSSQADSWRKSMA